MRIYDRAWIAAVLTGQMAIGVILGVAAQAQLAYDLIFCSNARKSAVGLLDLPQPCRLELPTLLIRLLAAASWRVSV